MRRASGVLMHISSLPGDYSVGSFGKEGLSFVDFLANCGFSYWQVLPFCLPDAFGSPYQSPSAFSINPYLIDLRLLTEKGYLTKSELAEARQQTDRACEFKRLLKERLPLLKKCAERAPTQEVWEFLNTHPTSMEFCRFMALKEINANKPWRFWKIQEPDPKTLFFWGFTQLEGFQQWAALKQYANAKGIQVIGDVPIYVAYDSSDVYYRQDQFLLTPEGLPELVAGVPPDYFSPRGQLWNNPVYNWKRMEQTGFSWWKSRILHALSLFDGLRLDHFRGFESFWAVPFGAETAENGSWLAAGGWPFIQSVKKLLGERLCIAEDLGHITPEVRTLREESGFPGMSVLQFGFFEEESPHHYKNYGRHTVAYTGTHDNNTLRGFLEDVSKTEKLQLLSLYGKAEPEKLTEELICAMLGSLADLIIFPVQDLLGLGSKARMNTPGRAEGNWAFRVTQEQLAGLDQAKLSRLNQLFGRAPLY